jgi:AcrR family transcriptional regulator
MRKKPKQDRSRVMVSNLIDATAMTIAEHGLSGATAARIASRAGVSPGSLYQYFDCKEDLYAATLEQIAGGLQALIHAQIEQLPDKSVEAFVSDLLHAVWEFLEADDQRYMRITRYWAQMDFVRVMNNLERQMTVAMTVYVMHHPPATPIVDLPTKVYILVNSVLFTIVRYISEPTPHVSREQIIASIAQMAAMMMNQPLVAAKKKRR